MHRKERLILYPEAIPSHLQFSLLVLGYFQPTGSYGPTEVWKPDRRLSGLGSTSSKLFLMASRMLNLFQKVFNLLCPDPSEFLCWQLQPYKMHVLNIKV